MARGVNKVILIGNLGADPEMKSMPSGNSVTNLRLATDESYRDRQSGEMVQKVEWHRVTLFGRLAEVAAQYLRKGSKVYIEGKLQTRKWQDQNGQDRYSTEVVVDINGQMQMLDSRSNEGRGADNDWGQSSTPSRGEHKDAKTSRQPVAEPVDDFDDDIPF